MPRKYGAGAAGRSIVVMNQDSVAVDPMKRHSNRKLSDIKTCSECQIRAPRAHGSWGGVRLRGADTISGAAFTGSAAGTGSPAGVRSAGNPVSPAGTRPPDRQGGWGTFIPFASGSPVAMLSAPDGQGGTASLVGFGNSADGVTVEGGTIDLAAAPDMAFSLPEDGRIASFAAHFSLTEPLSLGETAVTVTVRLYQSPAPGNRFTPVPSAALSLSPRVTGTAGAGTVCSGSLNHLSIPLARGTRLLTVCTAEKTYGNGETVAVTGYLSAGLAVR
jgi:BclB C-terminal domain-containing protein